MSSASYRCVSYGRGGSSRPYARQTQNSGRGYAHWEKADGPRSRHRNPELWGADVDEFNPRREFRTTELSHVSCPTAAASQQSVLFSPFAHRPRNSSDRNFAQMEMRLILTQPFRIFRFELAGPTYD